MQWTLGSPILSPSRILIGQVAVFMQWQNEIALANYLEQDSFWKNLSKWLACALVLYKRMGEI